MGAGDYLAQWRKDERLLADIGAVLFGQETAVEVRLPRELADAAVEAWQRDEQDDVLDLSNESCEDYIVRHRAGALGLTAPALAGVAHQGVATPAKLRLCNPPINGYNGRSMDPWIPADTYGHQLTLTGT